MEMTVAHVAAQSGRTPRLVRQAVDAGRLSALRTVGRQLVLDDLAVTTWVRATARGPLWQPHTREAALDLLSEGRTSALSGSRLSRLRSALRTMDARAVAHAAGGLGGPWSRYRAQAEGGLIGPSAVCARRLGIVDGAAWPAFVETDDLDEWELRHDAVLDADGDVGVVERKTGDDRLARVLIDCYLLGDARASSAAAALLEERAIAL